jgi:hypothetical protein
MYYFSILSFWMFYLSLFIAWIIYTVYFCIEEDISFEFVEVDEDTIIVCSLALLANM